jgi:hypothetical protein
MVRRFGPGLLAVLIGLSACEAAQRGGNEAAPAAPVENAAAPGPLAEPDRPLDRSAVLLAVVRARSAAAAGSDDAALQRELDGRRFEFRIRLGCTLAGPSTAGAQAVYDPEKRQVELSVGPDLTLASPLLAAAAAGQFEAAEGFAVAEPWLLVPHCIGGAAAPVVPVDSPQPKEQAKAAPEQLGATGAGAGAVGTSPPSSLAGAGAVGLVQFFTAADPRSGRRNGRPYETRETLPEGSAAPVPGSWELVLSGRLQALPNKRVIACQPVEPSQPPACIVSVRVDRAAIVNRASGARLAEWTSG